jgi:bifunctional non-homologous end joining protein LigD
VYIDYLQNGHGRLLVSSLSVRPVPGAQVSTVLEWSEVNDALDPKAFTINTVPPRLLAMKKDPMIDVLSMKPKLGDVLSKLGQRLKKSG